MGIAKKKQPIVLSSAPVSVFASPEIFCHAPAFVFASPLIFFGFALVFFRFDPLHFLVLVLQILKPIT